MNEEMPVEAASDETPAAFPLPANVGAVPQTERIVPIDVLRGFALLGILAMNIQSFAMPGIAYVMPHAYGDMTGVNYLVWLYSHVFADQKFMTIFSMLFGAGIVLMTQRQEAHTGRSAAVHYRRTGMLLMFGLIHAYLIWYGDILVAYALCGMAVYPFRRLRPGTLLLLGLVLIAVKCGIDFFSYQSVPDWPKGAAEALSRGMSPDSPDIPKELTAYRGGWTRQLSVRAMAAIEFETFLFAIWFFWRASGLMLVGMALFKLGVFSAKRPPATYWSMFVGGLLIGIPIILYGNWMILEHRWDPIYTMFRGMEYNYVGSLFVSMAYVGAVMLVCQQPNSNWLTRPFAAVGQMALTNYLLHSIVCTTIFYGHGFGYFGYVERVGQISIVFAVWAFQLIASPIWLKYFRFGPAEWLWRALTYWALPPMRRGTTGEGPGVP